MTTTRRRDDDDIHDDIHHDPIEYPSLIAVYLANTLYLVSTAWLHPPARLPNAPENISHTPPRTNFQAEYLVDGGDFKGRATRLSWKEFDDIFRKPPFPLVVPPLSLKEIDSDFR